MPTILDSACGRIVYFDSKEEGEAYSHESYFIQLQPSATAFSAANPAPQNILPPADGTTVGLGRALRSAWAAGLWSPTEDAVTDRG